MTSGSLPGGAVLEAGTPAEGQQTHLSSVEVTFLTEKGDSKQTGKITVPDGETWQCDLLGQKLSV